MLHCTCCDGLLVNDVEIDNGYCSECQNAIRQVWDKDANALGQVEGNVNKLDWTNYEDEENDIFVRYKGEVI